MIRCCYGCIAPKRYPGCHAQCQEYIKEKAVHDAQHEEERKKKEIRNGITIQRAAGVRNALKKGRKVQYFGKML
jgi:hypothetical protein